MNKVYYFLIVIINLFVSAGTKLEAQEILRIGAIPDQKPEKLNRLYNLLSSKIEKDLGVTVRYLQVTNYAAAVTAFRTKSIDLVWFGGLTGVQARLQTPGSIVLAQRDIDSKFKSVFIANKRSNLNRILSIPHLNSLKGKRFLFGSENSTSGRLMPQYYLNKADVKITEFKGGHPGFSGSHDATIALVQSGSYEVGALNKQVWEERIKEGVVNKLKVKKIWETPTYYDYHWLVQGDLDDRFGNGFTHRLQYFFLNLSKKNESDSKILNLFGANRFIKSKSSNYIKIEQIGREIGKIK